MPILLLNFEIKCIFAKTGRGTFTTRSFDKGEFLLEYRGELLPYRKGNAAANQDFIFYFKHGEKRMWLVQLFFKI